jgi:hypothetical protein
MKHPSDILGTSLEHNWTIIEAILKFIEESSDLELSKSVQKKP